MSLFIESIKIESGIIHNLEFHQKRYQDTMKHFFPSVKPKNLGEQIHIPEKNKVGICKCRITYSRAIENIEFSPYVIKNITSLKMVNNNSIIYEYKYKNRAAIEELFQRKGDSDDIVIIKNKRISDSSISNIVFKKAGIWYTPKSPLLKGTRREKLIASGLIKELDILATDFLKFEKAGLINAMMDLEECTFDINCIYH